jgi:hypothetical protein
VRVAPIPPRPWRHLLVALSGPFLWLLTVLLPPPADEWIARHLSAPLSQGISLISRAVPFSLSEIVLVALVLGLFVDLWRRLARTPIPRWRRWLAWGYDLLRTASVLVVLFYVLWGIGYGAPPLASRIDLPPLPDTEAQSALEDFAKLAIARTNAAYLEAQGSSDLGRPSRPPSRAPAARELRRSMDRLLAEDPGLALAPRVRAPLKTLLGGEFFHRMGISGIYSPFLAEAHVLGSLPGCTWGLAMAHEMAHQRGVHREDEANFVGFLVAIRSSDPILRYSGWLFAQRQALFALGRIGSARVSDLLHQRLPGVQRDVDDLHRYWEVARGTTGRIATRMNHAYLRSNRVAGGVASYGRSLGLILRWQAAGRPFSDPTS